MTKFPFQLEIERICPEKRIETLSCTNLLRVIPGRRHVYDAKWGDKSVIVKVFSHNISAKRHLKREWRGLRELTRRGLSCPAPLFYGKMVRQAHHPERSRRTKDGQWAIVIENITDSSTALDVFNKTADKKGQLDLLIQVCQELARQHSKGVLQKDLHLGNFLWRKAQLFAIDPARMYFFSKEIGRDKSISQLALLARCLPENEDEAIARLCQEYFEARGWAFEEPDKVLFQEQLNIHRKKGIRHGLKKCLRTSTRHLRIQADKYVAVFSREFCMGVSPHDFVEQIDSLMDKGQILKNGNTSYVSRFSFNGKDVVVKRYNHKGIFHSLRHTIKKSRARQGWLHAHRLMMLQVSTPKPLAYIEKRKGLLLWQSYLVTEYIQGRNLYDFLRDDRISNHARSMMIRQIKELLERLGKYRISHGDMKHSNILVTENGPVLTDLDGMKVSGWGWTYIIKRNKDIARLVSEK